MPIELLVHVDDVISLDEFRKRVLDKVDPNDADSLASIALDLRALANDRELIVRQIGKDIGSWQRPEFAMYSAQSCILDRFGPFTVRANLWPSTISTPRERDALSYNAYHDHNFSFATTNLYGPGYTTELYEYRLLNGSGEVGDKVSLLALGERRLSKGSVVIYRKGVDMHAQIPPSLPSASLNLIINDDDVIFSDQFYFDPVRGIIVGLVENVVAKRISALSLGRFLGSPRSSALLETIAATSACRRSQLMSRKLMDSQLRSH